MSANSLAFTAASVNPTRVMLAPDCERTIMYDRDDANKVAWVRDVVLRPHVLYTPGNTEQIARVRGDALDEIRGYVTGQARPATVPANEDSLAQCITFALSLVKALPSDVPMPVVMLSDHVTLDWVFDKTRCFMVIVHSDGLMAFSGSDDSVGWEGTVRGCANAETYPAEILAGIRWAMPQRKPEGIE